MKTYYFPGLGADESLRAYHRIEGLDAQWVKWPSIIKPNWDAFLSDLFSTNEIEEGALFIGISFGGLVALHAANKKNPIAIILIGSLTTPKAISSFFRPFQRCLKFLPTFLFNLRWVPPKVIAYFFGIQKVDHLNHFFRMVQAYTPSQTKGLLQLAMSAPTIENEIPLYAVHGEKDRILPVRNLAQGYMVKGGGHLLSMTHTEEVNGAILNWMKSQKWARE